MRECASILYMAFNHGKMMNPLDLLLPDTILAQVERRAENLLSIINEKRKSLSKAPAGRLKMARQGGHFHCYHVTTSENLSGRYIPVAEKRLVQRLAQKEYDEKALREMKRQLSLMESFIAKYKPETLAALYEKLSPNRKPLVEPVQFSDEDYATRWLSEVYEGKGFESNAPELSTAKGERVRSKSEVIIADTLARHGVPYKYERPLLLSCGASAAKRISVYPDFTCLNLRTRKEFLWEHLGRMDDAEYAKKTVAKLRAYSKNGFVLGRNLIVTMECEGNPLNRFEVEYCVKSLLR